MPIPFPGEPPRPSSTHARQLRAGYATPTANATAHGGAATQDARRPPTDARQGRPIPDPASLPALLHTPLALLWGLAALAALLRSTARWPAPAAALAAALLLALVPLQLDSGGWWPAMAERARYGLLVAALLWAGLIVAGGSGAARWLAPLASLALAGFYLSFGAIALGHQGPVPGFLALKSSLAGIAVLATLALDSHARRPAAFLLVAMLTAATILAATRWAPAVPAAGFLEHVSIW